MQTDAPIEKNRLLKSLNGILPDSVVVKTLDEADKDFHARYHARLRHYAYYINVKPSALLRRYQWHVYPEPDFERMNAAARTLIGTHNFSVFCKTASSTINRECHITKAGWLRGSPWPIDSAGGHKESSGSWVFRINADRLKEFKAFVATL